MNQAKEQQEPTEAEQDKTNTAGVDFVVSAETILACGINEYLKDAASVACFDINQRLNDAHFAAKPDHQPALALLAALTNYHFDPAQSN